MAMTDAREAYFDRCKAAGFTVREVRTKHYSGPAVIVSHRNFYDAVRTMALDLGIVLTWDAYGWFRTAVWPVVTSQGGNW